MAVLVDFRWNKLTGLSGLAVSICILIILDLVLKNSIANGVCILKKEFSVD